MIAQPLMSWIVWFLSNLAEKERADISELASSLRIIARVIATRSQLISWP